MSAYTLDLSGCYLKFNRAKIHIDDLSNRIDETFPYGKMVPLAETFDSKQSEIVIYIERVIEPPHQWSLIVGDAVHNLRGVLDHLAWQLALRYFNGVKPTDDKIIKAIQFPIVSDAAKWPTHRHRKFMLSSDADNLEEFQPFNHKSTVPGDEHLFELFFGFGGISNVDKHRTIQLTEAVTTEADFPEPRFTDCVLRGSSASHIVARYMLLDGVPEPGKEVWRVPVTVTGPNPQMEFDGNLSGSVLIRNLYDVRVALDAVARMVARVVAKF